MSHQANTDVLEHIKDNLTDKEIKQLLDETDTIEVSIIALYEKVKELKVSREEKLNKLKKHLTAKYK